MPRILVQTDDGTTVNTFEFPLAHVYALAYMPSCPQHTGIHNLLTWLPRTLRDAANVQAGVDSRRLSEIVMDRMESQSYKIVRYYRDFDTFRTDHVLANQPVPETDPEAPREVVRTGLSFKEARDHCAGPDAKGDGWHDTYEAE